MKDSKNEIKILCIIIAIIVIAIIIVIVNQGNNKNKETNINENKELYVYNTGNDTKINVSEELNNSKKVGNYEFYNIQFTSKEGQSQLIANIKNNSQTDCTAKLIEITFFDTSKKVIGKINGVISPIKAGGTTAFSTNVSADYVNAYDFEITIK